MSAVRRLRLGELLALAGAVVLAVSAFVPWFTVPSAAVCRAAVDRGTSQLTDQTCAILSGAQGVPGGVRLQGATLRADTLGHPWLELLAVAAVLLVLGAVLAVRAAPGRPTAGAVVAFVVAGPVALMVLAATAVRVLLLRPTTDVVIPLEPRVRVTAIDSDLAAGPWLALAGLALGAAGAWIALRDERRSAYRGAVAIPVRDPPPAPRPAADGD